MTTNTGNPRSVALIRANGTYQGAGWLTLSGSGRSRKIEIEHVDGLGVLPRDGYTIEFGDDATGCEGMTAELRRAGWKVA